MKLSSLRQEGMETWYAERLGHVSPTTANKELARLKHLLGRAVTWGYLKASPARAIKKAKEAPGRVRYLSPEEYEKLLNGADVTVKANNGRYGRRDRRPTPRSDSTYWPRSTQGLGEASSCASDGLTWTCGRGPSPSGTPRTGTHARFR